MIKGNSIGELADGDDPKGLTQGIEYEYMGIVDEATMFQNGG